MNSWLHNRSISFRVNILAGVGILGVLSIYTAYLLSHEEIEKNRIIREEYNRTGDLVAELDSQMLEIRRHEKDFLLDPTDLYVDRYAKASEEAERVAEALAAETDDPRLEVEDRNLRANIAKHREQFATIVAAQRELGFNENEGLQNVLIGAVLAVEDILESEANTQNDLWRTMLMMRRYEKDFINRVEEQYIDLVLREYENFKSALADAPLAAGSKEQITEKLSQYVTVFQQYASQRLLFNESEEQLGIIYRQAQPSLDLISQTSTEKRLQAMAKSAAVDEESFRLIMIIAIGVGIIALVISRFIIAATVGPVKSLEKSLQRVADGDYETPVSGIEFKDEIGTMAKVAEQLKVSAKERVELEKKAREDVIRKSELERQQAEKEARAREEQARKQTELTRVRDERARHLEEVIARFEASIASAVGNLGDASGNMKETAEVMVDVADTTGRKSQSVREESVNMQENIAAVLAAIEQFTASISEVNSQVQNAGSISEQAVVASDEGGQAISQLSDSSKQIEDVVKLIHEIAEQTNLLALNATIEAARAGDAGRGFAVVASEVKSLATQTAKATDEITLQIQNMQSATAKAVGTIGSIGDTIESLNDVMVSITAAVEEQQATTGEINRSVHYTSDGTNQVASEIKEVSEGAGKTGEESSKVMAAAEVLDGLSGEIRHEVETFLSEVRSIQASMDDETTSDTTVLQVVNG